MKLKKFNFKIVNSTNNLAHKIILHSKNKFGYVYVLTPHGLSEKAELTGRFLKRKMAEYEMLKQEIDTLKAEMSEREGQA